MAAEYGHIALLIALAFACVQSIAPLIGAQTNRTWLMQYARPMALGQATFLIISFVALTYCFVVDDFSVSYVAHNSNSAAIKSRLQSAIKFSQGQGGESLIQSKLFFYGLQGRAAIGRKRYVIEKITQ